MSEEPDTSPEEDASIRALLGDLGSAPDTASMPPEVVARLDETLADLMAERAGTAEEAEEETHSNVVPLRRRWASRAAAAAAAVLVVGAGGVAAANLGLLGGGNDAVSDEATSGSAVQAESSDNSGTPPPSARGPSLQGLLSGVPVLTAASFDAEVTRLVAFDGRYAPDIMQDSQRRSDEGESAFQNAACFGPKVTKSAEVIRVLYDAAPAVLLVHPPRKGSRLVEAWSCSGDQRLDSAHVPVHRPASGSTSGQSSPGDPGVGSPDPTP